MTTTKPFWRMAKLPLAVSLASTLAAPAFGVSFNIGEIEGQLDSTLSVGASWSVRGGDDDLIGYNNGGSGLSMTSDDNHANFKRGETFSKIFKGIHDLELKYGDTGVFVRGKYWYDFELKDESRIFKDIDDSNRKQGAQSSGAEILDAFVYHNYSVAEQPGSVRLGKQVVSWGESTFIQGGINAVNPVDVAAFRRPGSEVKEGLIPVNMFYVSQSLTDNLSAELFYQLEWDQTVTDNCGTFFAQGDIIADGCDQNLAVLAGSDYLNALSPAAITALEGFGVQVTPEGTILPRTSDRDPRDSGQWGLALRYFYEPLDTEFGAYAMNYHSRLPIFSAQGASQAVVDQASAVGPLAPLIVAGNSNYFMEYPEDIRLDGLSFSTTLPTGTAWQGEISYRPNAPVQINTTDVLYSGLTALPASVNPLYPNASILHPNPGDTLHGYTRKEITQIQSTFTHFFDQVMGASRLTLVGEVGMTFVGGLEGNSNIRYGRDPIYGPGPLEPTNGAATCGPLNEATLSRSPNANQSYENANKYCKNDGFTTHSSWGYRARAIWDYPDVFAGINLRPSIAWSHDVDGYSPGPGGNFEEGRKAVSLGLEAEYQNTYTASLSYTDFFGGEFNTQADRDFVAFSVGASF